MSEVSESAMVAMLSAQVDGFLSLDLCERLSGGASQETYRVETTTRRGPERFALRRASGGEAINAALGQPGLRVEALLFRLAREAGVPEPEILYVLEPEDGLGEGFLMEWLEGETLGARIARAPEHEAVRPRLAFQCGEILARIHAIDVEAAGLREHLDVVGPREAVEQTWETYRALETPQPMIDFTGRWLLENLPPENKTALVHNDFRNGNLMIGKTGVEAVLDWELAYLGDPMRDLGWICIQSWRFGKSDFPVGGFGTYEDLFAGYASVTGEPVDVEHVRFWEVFGSFWWAIATLSMASEYRDGTDLSVERPAIGRRTSEAQVDCVNLLIPGALELMEPVPLQRADEMPRVDELIGSVRDFLRGDLMTETSGRMNFLSRVASNSLDIVDRELRLGPVTREAERHRLGAFLGSESLDLGELRWALVRGLRAGSIQLDASGLTDHLRSTVVNQLAIDQPRYAGYAQAIQNAGENIVQSD